MPRENTTILVEEISLDSHEKKKVTERLCAEIKKENEANIKWWKRQDLNLVEKSKTVMIISVPFGVSYLRKYISLFFQVDIE